MSVVDLKPRKIVFKLTPFEAVTLDTERRGYAVKGLLPDTGLAVIWGPPKTYKSFFALDLALHIATGRAYRGRQVELRPVVYIGLEGRYGLPARIEAFRRQYGVQRAMFSLFTEPLNLKRQVDVLIADMNAQMLSDPGVVVIDTLNRSLVGSESKDEDMSAYLAAATKIAQKFECLVVLVHHCGVDESRPRGHTSLSAAVDVQLAVKRLADREFVVQIERAKDMPEGAELFFRLETVVLGEDPDGDPITSLMVVPVDKSRAPPAEPKLSPNQQTMLTLLEQAGPAGLMTDAWNDRAREAGIGTKRRADLIDLREALKAKKLALQYDERWIAARYVQEGLFE
jgi:hypothetical protein